MKNIHILPTDKPSRLVKLNCNSELRLSKENFGNPAIYQNIYITNLEEIKEGVDQWYLDKVLNEPYNSGGAQYSSKQDVIILTTDQDLIKDGVQAIDDEFLEWFVKNPSCEEVEAGYGLIRLTETDNEGYWVSIPNKQFEMQQEEPKQETLEEAKNNAWNNYEHVEGNLYSTSFKNGFNYGAKWQAERMYSDMQEYAEFCIRCYENGLPCIIAKDWFEQFKKKS